MQALQRIIKVRRRHCRGPTRDAATLMGLAKHLLARVAVVRMVFVLHQQTTAKHALLANAAPNFVFFVPASCVQARYQSLSSRLLRAIGPQPAGMSEKRQMAVQQVTSKVRGEEEATGRTATHPTMRRLSSRKQAGRLSVMRLCSSVPYICFQLDKSGIRRIKIERIRAQ
ncbi:hypothetical protein T492DRAFT_961519 [Pavlovales sp. CCMP2436]|nr:hypothetical protein T492DRAFT_961519 [Pavlovales sp. CCMP2436]